MVQISEAEKEQFLEYIRGGLDRAQAARAVNPAYTGTMFKYLCSPSSRSYDPEFALQYDRAVDERGELDPYRPGTIHASSLPGRERTLTGALRWQFLDEERRQALLDDLRDGIPIDIAARSIETTVLQVNRLANHDEEFKLQLRQAREDGYQAYKERLRGEAYRQAMNGDYKALRDQLLIHLDEYKPLLTSRHEITAMDLRVIAERHFSDMPAELLEQMINQLQSRRELTT